MNELVWEGLIEILRGNQPSLKATARLWRRDDFFGADWGGQLELPVVFRRLLPPGEYAVRLPSGSEASVRITGGPSTTSMTFPTLTGIGYPPFGRIESLLAHEILEGETEQAMTEDLPATVSHSLPAAAPVAAVIAAAPPVEEPPSAVAPAVLEAPIPAPVPVVDEPVLAPASAATRLKLVERRPEPVTFEAQSLEQTETMARAYLAAVEARHRLQAVRRPGLEGRAIEAARLDIEAAATTLEGALRARAGTERWPQDLASRLAALSWFAELAAPDEQPEIAGAGATVHALVSTIEMLLAANSAVRSQAHAA